MRWREAPLEQALILTRLLPRRHPPEVLRGAAASSWGWSPRAFTPAVGVVDCCGLKGALKGAHRISLFTRDRDDSSASRHLEDVVAVVGDCHELGQGWIPEDGIVRQADVRDVEVDELSAVVLALSEGDRQADLPIGVVEPLVTPEKGLVG